MTTTTIYVVSVRQGMYDLAEVQVVTSFRTREAADEFIEHLEIARNAPTFKEMMKDLAAIHPRAVVHGTCDNSSPEYDCEECELN